MGVFSPVQAKSKLNNSNVHSSIIVERERECYNYVRIQFSVGLCQWIHICVHMYVLVCVCVHQGMHICVAVSMRRHVSVVCLCVEDPGCSPDFSWELQWSMSSVENSRSKPPTS